MRSFLEYWSSSLHKRNPRFSFGMMRFISMNHMYLWRNSRYRQTSPTLADFFYHSFLAELDIIKAAAPTYRQVPKTTASAPPLLWSCIGYIIYTNSLSPNQPSSMLYLSYIYLNFSGCLLFSSNANHWPSNHISVILIWTDTKQNRTLRGSSKFTRQV